MQHYIPKFYLNNFCSIKNGSEYTIFCFDKLSEESFPSNTKKIGCQNFFYDTDEDMNQSVEKTLGKLDTKFSNTYRKLLDIISIKELDIVEKETMAYYIANQFIRTPEFRRRMKSWLNRIEFYNKKKSIIKKIEELKDNKKIKEMQIKALKEYVPIYAEIILKMKWILITNKTSLPFWTSDNPVNNYNSTIPFPFGSADIKSSGIQIFFPLNTKKLLSFNDPKKFKNFPEKMEYKNKNEIQLQRKLQIIWSSKHIFSIDNNFRYAKKVLEENPVFKLIGMLES